MRRGSHGGGSDTGALLCARTPSCICEQFAFGQKRALSPARRERYYTSLGFPEDRQFIDEDSPLPKRVSCIHVLTCHDCEAARQSYRWEGLTRSW